MSLDKPPNKPPPKRSISGDSFAPVMPGEREVILRQMQSMEDRLSSEFSTEYGKMRAVMSDLGERVNDAERHIIELRANAVNTRELTQEMRGVREELRQHNGTMSKMLLNDVEVERIVGSVRTELAKQAKEVGAAAGEEAGLLAATKGRGKQALITTLVAGVVSGIMLGAAQSCEHLKKTEKPTPTQPAGP